MVNKNDSEIYLLYFMEMFLYFVNINKGVLFEVLFFIKLVEK